jgi:hypothetical protein
LALAENLKRFGAPVWLDKLDIPPGEDWDRAIDYALEHCDSFMIVLSAESVASDEVRAKLRTALDARKRIIPVLHKQVEIPRQLRLIPTGTGKDRECANGTMEWTPILRHSECFRLRPEMSAMGRSKFITAKPITPAAGFR